MIYLKNNKITFIFIITLMLIFILPSFAFAAGSISVGGTGGHPGAIGGGTDTGGTYAYSVWSLRPTGNILQWTWGNNEQKWNPLNAKFSFPGTFNTVAVTLNYSSRENIANRDNPTIFWYNGYIVRPAINDLYGDGVQNDGGNLNSSIIVDAFDSRLYNPALDKGDPRYSPRWSDWGYGADWPNTLYYYNMTGRTPNCSKLYQGVQRPIWNNTNDNKINTTSPQYSSPFKTTGSSLNGSSVTASISNIINNPNYFEGRYGIFGIAIRGRGQDFNKTGTAYTNRDASGIIVRRPRVRVNILDKTTGQSIPGATWYFNTTIGKKGPYSSGWLAGTTGSGLTAPTDAPANIGALNTAIKKPGYGTNMLPVHIPGTMNYSALVVNVPTEYTFANIKDDFAEDVDAKRYNINSLSSPATSLWENYLKDDTRADKGIIINSDDSVSFIGNGTSLPIGTYSSATGVCDGGFYDITIYVEKEGVKLSGVVYNDANKDGQRQNPGETLSVHPYEVVVVPDGASPSSTPIATAEVENGTYSVNVPIEHKNKDVDLYLKLWDPVNSVLLPLDSPLNIPNFQITQPGLGVSPLNQSYPAHKADLYLDNNKTQDFGIYFTPPSPNPDPQEIETDITGPFNWLNSNKQATFEYTPPATVSLVSPDGSKTIRATLEYAEVWYPKNYDWAYDRVQNKDKTIQPYYGYLSDVVRPISITTNASWKQENADVSSNIISIDVPPYTETYNSLDSIMASGHFKIDTPMTVHYTRVTSPGGYYGNTPLAGGLRYFGVSAYEVTETSLIDGTVINRYYQFGVPAVKNVKVYNTVGTN